jgi:two-component system cell cycle sensor histidine kinase/response regulator CckA
MAQMSTRPTEAPALFQALVENSSDAILLLDAKGTIRYASRSLERVLGYKPEERLGRSSFELIHPDDMPGVAEAFARGSALPGVPQTGELRLRHKDGSWRHIEVIAVNRLADPAVGGIVVNYRDVTDRKQATDALAASEQRLRHLFEMAPDIIYYCNPSGRFTYVNPTACRVMKYEEAELIGRHFLTLIRADYIDAAKAIYTKQLAERTPNTYFEFPAVAKDGETIWVGQHVQLVVQEDNADQVVGLQAITRDISKQKKAEDRLRESEARSRSLIQGAAYGIYRTTMDGEIIDANPALATMLGYASVDEVRAVNMKDIYIRAADRAALIAHFSRVGTDTLSEEVQWRRKDGTPIVVRLTAHIVDFEGAGVPCFEGIVEDITEKRGLEEQLRQSQKMEAVGRLARGIAHDFNNVLAAILGNADLIQLRLKKDDPTYSDVREIAEAAERGAALTRQLLAFSRRQAMEPEVLDLHEVVRGFDSMLQRLSGDIELGLHTPGPAPLVRIEPGQIEQVVMNLVVNARDAVPEGGTINVYADIVAVDAQTMARYPAVVPGSYARIAVRDTGVGIDPEIERHVFEPFFTTKDPAKGTGLGLSIVYGIAKHAGGGVTFSSTPGQGTIFEVLLPLARRD